MKYLLKTFFIAIFFIGFFFVYVPHVIVSVDNPLWLSDIILMRCLAVLPFLTGLIISIMCVLNFAFLGQGTPAPFDPPKILVIKGFYNRVRNPMYIGGFLILFGLSLFFQSAYLLTYLVILSIFFHCFVIFYEEPILRKNFGSSYIEYCKMVPRWVPKLKKD